MNRPWRRLAVAFLILFVVPSAQAQTARIDPAGVPGSLLLCGGGDVAKAAFERFIELAGGENAKVVLVVHNPGANGKKRSWSEIDQLKTIAEQKKAGIPVVIPLTNCKKSLREATGVWLLVDSPKSWQDVLQKDALGAEFHGLLKRGGVLATAGAGADLMATSGALPLLPGLVEVGYPVQEESKLADRLKTSPGLIGFRIDTGAAMLVKGRTISAVGARKITIYVPGKPALREISVEGNAREDLTALRRSAHDRATAFPPKQVEAPVLAKGTLVIVGGGGSPDGLYQKFVEFAGGPDKAKIAIFPTASDPIPKRDGLAEMFRKAGAKKATVLYGRTQAEVESKEFLDTLKEATGLWFDGGRQWRFVDCYENTRALPLMFEVLQRGGVIGGTSAGATIQGDYLARGGVFNNFDIRYQGYERGLGFLKGVAIDQHFSQRKRQAEMTELMKIHPQYLGIGLDEATAIVVKGQTAEVIGRGRVFFYDTNRKVEKSEADFEALPAGGRYDLKARKVLAK